LPRQPGFWSVEDRLRELSAQGDPLEKLQEIVAFELFRPVLDDALGGTDRSKSGRPPFDAVLKLKMLYLQAQHGLSFEATERLVRDRLSWMRFCGLSIADPVPDANTLWDFREALIRAGAFDKLFEQLDRAIKDAGYLPMSGQIVDASLVAAPRQRNTEGEKAAIKAGKTAVEIWPDKPAKAAQKDTDARWTVKTSKGKVEADGTMKRDLAIPAFGYKSHIGIDRRHGFIRRQKVTDAAAHDGARLREGLIDPGNTASDVWADTAYQSKANEDFLADRGKRSQIHRRKPAGKPMPQRTAKANARKSAVRAKVEHVFAQQKDRMKLTIRSIGIKRAEATIVMANLAYNLGRWRWWETRTAFA
jgi:transposase, IS5 family